MVVDRTRICFDDCFVLHCGRCGRPMRVCRAASIQCSAPPVYDYIVPDAPFDAPMVDRLVRRDQ